MSLQGSRRVRWDKAEETKLLLLRVFCVPVKVPRALNGLPHQHSEVAPQEPEAQSLLAYSKSPARQWESLDLNSGVSTPEIVLHSSHPLWFFTLLSSLQPGYV